MEPYMNYQQNGTDYIKNTICWHCYIFFILTNLICFHLVQKMYSRRWWGCSFCGSFPQDCLITVVIILFIFH
jgi:hypothetical protein